MQLSRLQRVVIDALEDIKGQDIGVYFEYLHSDDNDAERRFPVFS